MVFALAGDSTTTTFINRLYGARSPLRDSLGGCAIKATQIFSARKRGCRGGVRLGRLVPAREGGWPLRRLTSGIGVPVRQPRPGSVPISRRSVRARHHLPLAPVLRLAANSSRPALEAMDA